MGEDVAGTLRAQEHGHQPLVMGLRQEAEARMVIELFENHGIDSRSRLLWVRLRRRSPLQTEAHPVFVLRY